MPQFDSNEVIAIGKFNEAYNIFDNNGFEYVETSINILRKSKNKEVIDTLIVITSKDLYDQISSFIKDYNLKITGEIRTYSVFDEKNIPHLKTVIFTKSIQLSSEESCCKVKIVGKINSIKPLRETHLGKKIRDFVILNRYTKCKKAYIPSICWERFAKQLDESLTGKNIIASGALHSRKYYKVVNDIKEEKVAYEFSVNEFKIFEIENEEEKNETLRIDE